MRITTRAVWPLCTKDDGNSKDLVEDVVEDNWGWLKAIDALLDEPNICDWHHYESAKPLEMRKRGIAIRAIRSD